MDPIWIDIILFIGRLVETLNKIILSMAFIASSLRVTEENLVFETVQSGPYSSFECFLCSKRNLLLYFICCIRLALRTVSNIDYVMIGLADRGHPFSLIDRGWIIC